MTLYFIINILLKEYIHFGIKAKIHNIYKFVINIIN